MDNKFNAVVVYRAEVSQMIHHLLLFPHPGMTLTKIASVLHITIGQCSKVYHGCCSLSPEKFLKLFSVYALAYGEKQAYQEFIELLDTFQNGTL